MGGAVGPFISHYLTNKKELRIRREQHFEAIINAIHEHDHWLNCTKNNIFKKSDDDLGYPPIKKAVSLTSLYFPELMPHVNLLELNAAKYLLWIHNADEKRLNGRISSMDEGYGDAYEPYLTALGDFRDAAAAYLATRKGEI